MNKLKAIICGGGMMLLQAGGPHPDARRERKTPWRAATGALKEATIATARVVGLIFILGHTIAACESIQRHACLH